MRRNRRLRPLRVDGPPLDDRGAVPVAGGIHGADEEDVLALGKPSQEEPLGASPEIVVVEATLEARATLGREAEQRLSLRELRRVDSRRRCLRVDAPDPDGRRGVGVPVAVAYAGLQPMAAVAQVARRRLGAAVVEGPAVQAAL